MRYDTLYRKCVNEVLKREPCAEFGRVLAAVEQVFSDHEHFDGEYDCVSVSYVAERAQGILKKKA
jgi:hypothetical protein